MCAVPLAVGKDNPKFVAIGCINVVVAANAGGAFSPFGDITTLMVWQRGIVEFGTFFLIFVPSAVNYLIPAFAMSLAVSDEKASAGIDGVPMKRGASSNKSPSRWFFPISIFPENPDCLLPAGFTEHIQRRL